MTKLSGFLISWAMPAVSWPSEASFSVCTRRSWAVRRSSSDVRKFARAPLLGFKQPGILDGDRRLIGKGRGQLDLLVRERPDLCPRQRQNADRDTFAQHGHAEEGAKFTMFDVSANW